MLGIFVKNTISFTLGLMRAIGVKMINHIGG
jgi:hypothetical protein